MDPRFALLLACFFLSGFAALLYQTTWTRELSFVFETNAVADFTDAVVQFEPCPGEPPRLNWSDRVAARK